MSFSSKENLMNYVYKILHRFNVSDYKLIAPEYFEMSVPSLEEALKKRKLPMNKKNLSNILLLKIKKENWSVGNIIEIAIALELDYVIKYSNRFEWRVCKFVGRTTENEISDLGDSILSTIRKAKQDASVVVKESGDFFWISISMKNLKKIGIFEKPNYIVLSTQGKYCFTKDKRSDSVIKYVITALGYEREKKKKLSGYSLPTLMKLLTRNENADFNNRPIYEGGEAVENEYGLDFTQKKNYFAYYDQCVDNETDINLQSYTVVAENYPWLGDTNQVLREMEYKSYIKLKGNVGRIIKQLCVASIVKPPLPNYLRDFSVCGRNIVSQKSSLQ